MFPTPVAPSVWDIAGRHAGTKIPQLFLGSIYFSPPLTVASDGLRLGCYRNRNIINKLMLTVAGSHQNLLLCSALFASSRLVMKSKEPIIETFKGMI